MCSLRTLVWTTVLITTGCVATDEPGVTTQDVARGGGGGNDDGGGAKSGACAGGAFSIALANGTTIATNAVTTIPAAALGTSFLVKGTHIEFEVDAATFGVRNWTLTGAANPEALTNQRTVIFASKLPDHRGLQLTGDVSVDLGAGNIDVTRSGAGVRMTVTAKDCAQGGVFQMEVERGDATTTTFTHVLAPSVFFYDNPNFRNRNGETFQFDADTLLTITPRINFSSDLAPALVGRDSPQEATRVTTGCVNRIPNLDGSLATVDHCGGVSTWSVKSGARMGQVMGEDSIALEPPQPICTHQCQSRSRVKGRGLSVGFPSPVPAAYRFSPRS